MNLLWILIEVRVFVLRGDKISPKQSEVIAEIKGFHSDKNKLSPEVQFDNFH